MHSEKDVILAVVGWRVVLGATTILSITLILAFD